MDTTLPAPIRTFITAVNAFDGDTLIAAFSDDAVVNDARREFCGINAISSIQRRMPLHKATLGYAAAKAALTTLYLSDASGRGSNTTAQDERRWPTSAAGSTSRRLV